MSEDNEPDRLADLAQPSEFMIREMEWAQRMFRDNQPMIRQIQQVEALRRQVEPIIRASEVLRRQMEPYIRGHEALRRQIEPIATAAEQFASITNWPKINIGPTLPYPLWLAIAMNGQMRELLSPRPAAYQRGAALDVNVAMTATAEVAAAEGLALSPTVLVSDGDSAAASESGSVKELDSRRRVLAGLSAGQILPLVLVWLLVLVIPAAAWDANLPPEIQALVDAYDGILANVAVAITFDILGKRNKR